MSLRPDSVHLSLRFSPHAPAHVTSTTEYLCISRQTHSTNPIQSSPLILKGYLCIIISQRRSPSLPVYLAHPYYGQSRTRIANKLPALAWPGMVG